MDKNYCPICKGENHCMTSVGEQGNCWCFAEEFPKEIFELVPEESKRKHCICKSCLNKYKVQKPQEATRPS